MKRKILSVILALVLVLTLRLVTAVPAAAAATVTVPGDYGTIQAAIDAASSGDTITVAAGAYTENVDVDKSLTLQGAGSATTTVNAADPAISVFNVTASDVNISGFTVSGATGGGQAGIYLGAGVANCNIHDNILTGSFDGIWLGSGSNHNTLENNTLSSNYQGFEVYISNYNTFTNNIANSNSNYGFKIDSGDHNTFTGNTANSNTKYGFYVVEGDGGGATNSTFTSNTANFNTQYGMRMNGGSGNTLTGNTFNLNILVGIRLKDNITNLSMQNNNITNNPIGIDIDVSVADVTSWTVTHNNITGNTTFGVSNLGTGTLNAENNWWGDASGPNDPTGTNEVPPCTADPATQKNADGTGDKVSDNVDYCPWLILPYGQVAAATGAGIASFSTSGGIIEDLTAVAEGTLPTSGKPNVTFPFGFFSFRITGLATGQTVVVTITLPSGVPIGTQYWKYHASEGGWIQIPMGSNDGDNVITITLVDGGLGDADLLANGTIVDPGGPAVPPSRITVTSPDGGENWAPGSIHNITWTYANVSLWVRIELYKGGTLVKTIAPFMPRGAGGSGFYSWTIPPGQTAGTDYRIKIVSTSTPSVSDTSNANFYIGGGT